MKLRKRVRNVIAGAAAVAFGLAGMAAAAPSASAASFSCRMTVKAPKKAYGGVSATMEVKCNKKARVGGYLSLYRNGVFLVSKYAPDNYNTDYAYVSTSTSCVSGAYHAVGYGFGNHSGGAPEFAQTITTPTVNITC